MWCAADNHNYIRHICAKGFLEYRISTFEYECPPPGVLSIIIVKSFNMLSLNH